MPFIAIAAAIILALGGGASVAANNSLPGDALYLVKIHVNENLESALSFSAKSKADADVSAAENRLDEAEQLQAQGKLDSSTEAQINGNFDAHVKAVEASVARMQADGEWANAAEVAAKFQATLIKRSSALTEAHAHAEVHAQAALAGVISKVQATLNAASNLSANASAQAVAHGETGEHGNATSSIESENDDHGSANTGSGHVQGGMRVRTQADGDASSPYKTPADIPGVSGQGGVNVRL